MEVFLSILLLVCLEVLMVFGNKMFEHIGSDSFLLVFLLVDFFFTHSFKDNLPHFSLLSISSVGKSPEKFVELSFKILGSKFRAFLQML